MAARKPGQPVYLFPLYHGLPRSCADSIRATACDPLRTRPNRDTLYIDLSNR